MHEGEELTAANQQMLEKYLLGDLSEPERERIEKEYFTNDEAWELLTTVEDELIDSYIRGRLSKRQRGQFQNYFLQSPRRRERYEFALLLLDPAVRQSPDDTALSHSGERRSQLFWPGFSKWISAPQLYTAVTVLMLVICAFLTMQNGRLRLQVEGMRSEQTALQKEIRTFRESATSINSTQNESDTSEIFGTGQLPVLYLLLEPGNVRAAGSGSTHQIPRLATTPATVILALDLAQDEYPQYNVKIQSADGRTVREMAGLQSHPMNNGGRGVLIKIPSEVLPRGDYIVWLSGQAGSSKPVRVNSYLFSVID